MGPDPRNNLFARVYNALDPRFSRTFLRTALQNSDGANTNGGKFSPFNNSIGQLTAISFQLRWLCHDQGLCSCRTLVKAGLALQTADIGLRSALTICFQDIS